MQYCGRSNGYDARSGQTTLGMFWKIPEQEWLVQSHALVISFPPVQHWFFKLLRSYERAQMDALCNTARSRSAEQRHITNRYCFYCECYAYDNWIPSICVNVRVLDFEWVFFFYFGGAQVFCFVDKVGNLFDTIVHSMHLTRTETCITIITIPILKLILAVFRRFYLTASHCQNDALRRSTKRLCTRNSNRLTSGNFISREMSAIHVESVYLTETHCICVHCSLGHGKFTWKIYELLGGFVPSFNERPLQHFQWLHSFEYVPAAGRLCLDTLA